MEFISLNSDFNYNFLANLNGVKLTNRQIDVAACLIGRQKYKEIGRILSISPSTVDEHLKKIKIAIAHASSFKPTEMLEFFENADCYKHLREHYVGILIQHAFENDLSKIANRFRNTEKYVIKYHSDINKNSFVNKKIREHLKLVGISFDINDSTSPHQKDDSKTNVIYIIPKKIGTFLEEERDQSSSTIYITQESEQLFKKIIEEQSEQLRKKTPSSYHDGFFRLLNVIFKAPDIEHFSKELNNKKLMLEKNLINNDFSNKSSKTHQKPYSHDVLMSRTIMGKLYDICIKNKVILGTMLLLTVITILGLGKRQSQKEIVVAPQAEVIDFNLPRQLDYYTPRSEVTKLIWNTLKGDNKKTAILAGLHGLGGVGKTTLALNAIHNPNQNYEFRGWFRAESKDLLKADYFELGETLSLFEKDMSDKIKLSKVKEWLDKTKKVLLVYDNVPDMETLHDFLPHNGHVIITSRNYKLPKAIEVDVMTEKEALDLLNKLISKDQQKTASYQQQAKTLVNELGYLPLAVSQAGAYISENMLLISEYLNLYKEQKEKLLKENTLPIGDRHVPVYITWDMNIKNVEQHLSGDKSLRLLDFISCCHPENIPKKLLMQYLFDKTDGEAEIEFNNSLKLLRQYSLIKVSPDTISIHRLVHDWIRHKHPKEYKLAILKKGMKAIEAIHPCDERSFIDIKFARLLMPHVKTILSQTQPLIGDVEVANLISILGDIYFVSGDYDKSIYFFNKDLTINEKHFGPYHTKTAYSLARLGWSYLEAGKFTKAKQSFKKALQVGKKNDSLNNVGISYVLRGLGWTYIRLGNYIKAKPLLEKALVLGEKHYGPYHIDTSRGLRSLGWVNLCLGDFVKAKTLTEKAMFIEKTNSKANVINSGLHNFGWVNLYIGDYIKAKQLLEQALAINEKNYSPEHVHVLFPLEGLGWVNLWLGEYDKAKKIIEKALIITERHYGLNHIMALIPLNNLGWVCFYEGDYIKSKEVAEKVLTIIEGFFGNNHLKTSLALNSLGWTYLCLGDYTKALQLLEKSSNIIAKLYGDQNIYTAIALANQGNMYRVLGNTKESKELLEKAASILHRSFGEKNLHVAKIMANLGLLYGDLGDNARKTEYLEKSLIIFKQHLPIEHIDIIRLEEELKGFSSHSIKVGVKKDKSLGYLIVLPI